MNVVHRSDCSVTWGADEPGLLQCRSHALRTDDGRVWIIDPVDCSHLDDELRAFGEPAGVIVLLDRHLRDAPAIAGRLGVPLHFPAGTQRQTLPDGVHRFEGRIAECPFEFVSIRDSRRAWIERALWWPEREVLVVAEAVGTVPYFRTRPDDELGVHPMMHMRPPRPIASYEPRLLLVGHGDPLESPGKMLASTIARARRDTVRFASRTPKLLVAATRAARSGRAGC